MPAASLPPPRPAPAAGRRHERTDALRRGDERAFAELVAELEGLLLFTARRHVRTASAAEDVVQETWLAVLRGIGAFEGRCSLEAWILQILVNRAVTRALRDARCVPSDQLPEHGVRRLGAAAPVPDPARAVLGRALRSPLRDAVDVLPDRQRLVFALRDVEGWSADEVCDALDLSAGNQRVLLHRARARLRVAVAAHVHDEAA